MAVKIAMLVQIRGVSQQMSMDDHLVTMRAEERGAASACSELIPAVAYHKTLLLSLPLSRASCSSMIGHSLWSVV